MFCDVRIPPGHVAVRRGGHIFGVVCASHTLKEIILDPKERLTVEVNC